MSAITPELCKRAIAEDPNYEQLASVIGDYEAVMACPARAPAALVKSLLSRAYTLRADRDNLPESMRPTAGAIVWLCEHAALAAEKAKPLTPDFISKP